MRWMAGFLIGALVMGATGANAKTITRQIRIKVIVPQVQSAKVTVKRPVGRVYSSQDGVEVTARLETNGSGWKMSCTELRGGSFDIRSVRGVGRWHRRGQQGTYVVTPEDDEVRVRFNSPRSSVKFKPARVAITLVPN